MSIKLNKVGVDIDGKVYEMYKLTFGFQRQLIEVQTNLDKLQNEIGKKYNVEPALVSESSEVPESDKLSIAKAGLDLQDALASLFVNKEEALILDNFDGSNIGELIEALK